MNTAIKEISALETHEIRQPVLREGLSPDTCIFKGDDLATTFHLGVFEKDHLLGVATFLKKSKSAIQEATSSHKSMYQLRGMGISKNHQGRGLGSDLIKYAEDRLRSMNIQVLWFHARTSAVAFYQKMGYVTVGEELHLEPAGAHFIMYKEL